MKYFDIKLKEPSENGMSVVARSVHATIKNTNNSYAMAMPTRIGEIYTFDVMRIFTLNDDNVLDFFKVFNKDSNITISDTFTVPDDYDGDLVQYKYYSVQKPKKNTTNLSFAQALYEKRKTNSDELHYFKYSHSNRGGRENPKHFEVLKSEGILGEFDPNNYGLSSTNKQAWLPHYYL